MKQAIFYEQYGGNLHKCMYAGLVPQNTVLWMMVDQGCKSVTFDEYRQNWVVEGEFRLLCLKDEEVESATMASLLGAVIMGNGSDIPGKLSDCLKRLEKWNVSWQHDSLKMAAYIYEEKEEQQNFINFDITCEEVGFIAHVGSLRTVDDAMAGVHQYFDTLEMDAKIFMESKRLFAKKEILAMIRKEDLDRFD